MKAVVLGDIGWSHLYHLGDEAMTEAAIDLLAERGVEEITLVASEPEAATAFYGREAVPRVGFLRGWSRAKHERELAAVTRWLAEAGPGPRPAASGTTSAAPSGVYAALSTADIAVIAGGGNMNSEHVHHLYERVAFTRIARQLGVPLYVSSQTVGPMLRARDRELVAEIVDHAECFGAREATTFALVRSLATDPTRVHRTFDDALMLRPDAAAREEVDRLLQGTGRFVVGSFTKHPGTMGWGRKKYVQVLSRLLDGVATRNDVDVLLVPHAGTFASGQGSHDQQLNAEVVQASGSGRIRATPMLRAREAIELTRRAELSFSTRYHPTVFAPGMGTPTLSMSLSYYSSVRMRGALGNVGRARYVVPAAHWELAADAADELLADVEAERGRLGTVAERAHRFQSAWWDAVVAERGDGFGLDEAFPLSEEKTPSGTWSHDVEQVTPTFDDWGRQKIYSKWFKKDRDLARSAKAKAVERAEALARENEELREAVSASLETLRQAVSAVDRG